MNGDHFPDVFYIGPSAPGMILEQIHLGFWNVANVRTFWVPPAKTQAVRSRLTRDFQQAKRESPIRNFIYKASVLLQRASSGFDLGNPDGLPVEPHLIFVADVFKRLEGLNNFSCPKAYYVQDPHISVKRYFDFAHVEDYDYVFVTQKDFADVFRENGCKNVIWLPWACDHGIFVGRELERDIDISFFGTVNPGSPREPLVTLLERKFSLEREQLYLRNMGEKLRRSKIVFNKSLTGDLNQRNFEAMGAGALLVTDKIENGLFDLFKESIHLVTYRNETELEEKIRYYLTNESERGVIAQQGQMEVVSRHTYLHRAAQVLRSCLGIDLSSFVERKLRHTTQEILG